MFNNTVYDDWIARETAEVKAVPTVVGLMVYSIKKKVYHSEFTVEQDAEELEGFIAKLCDLTAISNLVDVKFTNHECMYGNLAVSTFRLGETYLFSVFHSQNGNRRIIKLKALNCLESFLRFFKEQNDSRLSDKRVDTADKKQEIVIKPSLRPRLDIIQNALSVALGDMSVSRQVMDEAIEKWAMLGPVSKKELPVLADILRRTINNEAKQEKFLEDIEDIFLGIKR